VKLVRVLLAGALGALSLFAADVSGTWTGVVKLGSAGQELPFVVQMKQQGDTITGRLDGINGAPDVTIMEGKISGDTITFQGVRKINGEDVKFNYTGTVAGDSIDFTILRADGTGMPLGSMTKRLGTPPQPGRGR
jgi:phage tail sheath gpL-like